MNQKDRNGAGATPRRQFGETYKRHTVALTLHGDRPVKTVAKELGLPPLACIHHTSRCDECTLRADFVGANPDKSYRSEGRARNVLKWLV